MNTNIFATEALGKIAVEDRLREAAQARLARRAVETRADAPAPRAVAARHQGRPGIVAWLHLARRRAWMMR